MRSALWFVVAVAACGGKRDEAAPAGTGSAVAAGSGSAAGSAPPAAAAAPPRVPAKADAAAVQQVVDAWLGAQNTGDFAAYSALYAEKFGGIKRVGARTWTFDRAGWLKDRSRMFKAPMQVVAKDITIAGTPAAASVLFTQGYTQGTFKDVGEKQLVIVKDGAGYKIAREEMLRSEVGRAASDGAVARYLVIDVNGNDVVVLGTLTTETHGALALAEGDGDVLLAAAPVTSSAPAESLTVIAADGTTCHGDVTSRIAFSGGTPHFGTLHEWDAPEDGSAPLTDAERAQAVFGMTTPYVAGVVANGAGDCRGVLAVPAGTKVTAFVREPPSVLGPGHEDPRMAEAVARFRDDARWKAIQREWKGTHGGKGPWEASAAARVFSGAGRTFVVVSAEAGSGCGEFEGSLGMVFEAKGGTLARLASHGSLEVEAIFDTNGDGNIELLVENVDWSSPVGLLEVDGDSLSAAAVVTFPFQDCGC